ncbi:MAG TPA: hypothetical protein VFH61_03105 [Thermoleophilia bacterium]|nr:hypothetical protein [Thermoleophilia bacterium]
MDEKLQDLRQRFIEGAGHTTQSFGAGRVIGQIFAHMYFSRDPQTLDDLTKVLGISKGSASMAVRQLEQWGALRRVWVKGDRKDYYEANTELGNIVRKALLDTTARRIGNSDGLLDQAEGVLADHRKTSRSLDEEWQFMEQRVHRLRQFRDRARWLWDKLISSMLAK